MAKFLIRNDDIAFDTELSEIKIFCEICDRYGFQIIQAITPIGEIQKIKSARMTNDQIKALSTRLFNENKDVLKFLQKRTDLIGVHGLWHTHAPSEEEIEYAKSILIGLELKPTYFVPPFNEGSYPQTIAGLKTCILNSKKDERLEDFLNEGTPTSAILYLHSWRFNKNWYTFDILEACLKRLTQQ